MTPPITIPENKLPEMKLPAKFMKCKIKSSDLFSMFILFQMYRTKNWGVVSEKKRVIATK